MRRTRWAAAIVAAAAVALTACSGTPAPAPAGEPSTLAAYYAQHLNWQPCDGGFECAQFVVPFDYAKPDGRRFTLPVVKLPAADPAHRVGALVINRPVESYPQPRIKAAGAPPILVVGTLRDPATPYRWAQAMAADLATGVLLGWNGDGHTAYGEGSACVDTIVNDYLIDLAIPRGGTVCQH